MLSYRDLVTRLQTRANLTADASLLALAVVVRALGRQLSSRDVQLLKKLVTPELHQLIAGAHQSAPPAFDGRKAIEFVADSLELDVDRSRDRLLIVIAELRDELGPWDDVQYAELLDHLYFAVKNAFVKAAVA